MDATGLLQTPASNIGTALAGRLPGLTVLQRSGVPGGEMMEFYIRGRSTINGQQPLILVDGVPRDFTALDPREVRSEEHTSELQSLMRISYAVFCLKKKNSHNRNMSTHKNNISENIV